MTKDTEKLLLWLERYNISASELLARIPLFKQRGKTIKISLVELTEETVSTGFTIPIVGNFWFGSLEITTGILSITSNGFTEEYSEPRIETLLPNGNLQEFFVPLLPSITNETYYAVTELKFIPIANNPWRIRARVYINGVQLNGADQSNPDSNLILVWRDGNMFQAGDIATINYIIENPPPDTRPTIDMYNFINQWNRLTLMYSDSAPVNFDIDIDDRYPMYKIDEYSDVTNVVLNTIKSDNLFGIIIKRNNNIFENVFQSHPGADLEYTITEPLVDNDHFFIDSIATGIYVQTINSRLDNLASNGFEMINLLDENETVIRSYPLTKYWDDNMSFYTDNAFLSILPEELAVITTCEFIPKAGNANNMGVTLTRTIENNDTVDTTSQTTNDEVISIPLVNIEDGTVFNFDFFN